MKSILIAAVALAGAATTACAPVQEGQAPPAGGVEPTPVACKASDYQEYVGRNRSTLPEAPAGRTFRVACSSCAVSTDSTALDCWTQ